MQLDQDLLREIKARADIVDVIGSYINVIKKGRNYAAVCPFHDDHDPSLHINKDKQTFMCYVCKHGGDVFTFVSDYEKISFQEAVLRVCEIINFDDPRLHQNTNVKPVREDIKVLYDCISELEKFYEYGLKTEEGKVAQDYLSKRKISDEQINKFGIGYALQDGKLTVQYLQQKGFTLKNIEDIGIALAKVSGTSDSNAGRLMFPIKNHNGQVVGFSARRLVDDDSPKYVNTGDTKIFVKGNVLYNYHIAKQSAKHDGFIYIVEGFMDVLALDSIGVQSVVALMGTKLTEVHLEMLKRLNVEVRLCLDCDGPGQQAMMEIMPMLDRANISYRIVSLPGELKDPDEILKKEGEEKLKVFINSLVDPFNFAFNYYTNTSPLGSIDDRKKVITHFAPMLLTLKSKLEFDDYVYKLSSVTGFNAQAIKDYIQEYKKHKDAKESTNNIAITVTEPKFNEPKVSRELKRLALAERMILKQMTDNKEAVEYYENKIKYFYTEIYRQLANFLLEYASENDTIDISMVIDLIQLSGAENKQELINELTAIANEKNSAKIVITKEDGEKIEKNNIAQLLDDCRGVIESERVKIHNRSNLKKALEGKDAKSQARILNDYLKNNKFGDN